MKKPSNLFAAIGEKTGLRLTLQLLVLLGLSLLQAVQLHYSAVEGFRQLFLLGWKLVLLNAALLLWLNLAVKLIVQKWYLSAAVTSLLTTLWSVANFYVLKFHGSPLYFSELANFRTAMNVVGGYSLAWERRISWLVLLGLAGLAAALLLWLCRKRKARFWVLRDLLLTLGAFAGVTALLWLSLFVWQKPKPRETVSWTWTEGVRGYGYPAAIVEDADRSIHYLRTPEGYDASHLAELRPRNAAAPAQCPDIILILNETFWDPAVYLELNADADCMEAFYGIDGAVYGYAAVPSVGGGTNNTEFELLTGSSMSLLTRYAPFNYVSFQQDETPAPRYLKALGYRSAALHCEPGSNYSRNRAYPAMGFDAVVMGNENFVCRSYGNRRNLDEDNYQDMLRVGESLGEGPRFLYLLTFQNHGGWETNDPEYDTVHVQGDYGELTDDLDELLTSIRMSGEAFRELTERLAASDRPTLVCMLGDHAPSFITKLPADPSWSEEEKQLRQRLVPYALWANFDMELPEQTDYAAAVDLLAMAYRAAGLPSSAYQDAILELHEQLPIRTSNGLYLDREGWIGKLADSPYAQTVRRYYELEYNALSRGGDYRKELFVCPVEE